MINTNYYRFLVNSFRKLLRHFPSYHHIRIAFDHSLNVGDYANHVLSRKISSVSSSYSSSNAFGIGSILQNLRYLKNGVSVTLFGSGSISSEDIKTQKIYVYPSIVRGRLSHQLLAVSPNITLALTPVVFGDLGLVLPLSLNHPVSPPPTSSLIRVGLVLHYCDDRSVSDIFSDEVLSSSNVSIVTINPLTHYSEFLRSLKVCDIVVSSSLHGLIFSDAFLIPNIWLSPPSSLIGGSFKFYDYYSAFFANDSELYSVTPKQTIDFKLISNQIAQPILSANNIINKQEELLSSLPSVHAFTLPLHYLQNLRLYQALCEYIPYLYVPSKYSKLLTSANKDLSIPFWTLPRYSIKTLPSLSSDFNHELPLVNVGNYSSPLVFPRALLSLLQSRSLTCSKSPIISFQGLLTNKRISHLNQFLATHSLPPISSDHYQYDNDSFVFSIIGSRRGRSLSTKGLDNFYYETLLKSQFTLCPSGDFVWTYRFFESIMCNSIPIVQDTCPLYDGFKFFTFNTPLPQLKYSQDIIDHNLSVFSSRFLLLHEQYYELIRPLL